MFGGVQPGLLRVAYQVGISDVVKYDPTAPTARHRAMQSARRRREGAVMSSSNGSWAKKFRSSWDPYPILTDTLLMHIAIDGISEIGHSL